jgi:hypothetical protein
LFVEFGKILGGDLRLFGGKGVDQAGSGQSEAHKIEKLHGDRDGGSWIVNRVAVVVVGCCCESVL